MKEYESIYITMSKEIQKGKEFTLSMAYCVCCKQHRRLSVNGFIGPGGTLSCPICKERGENGPGLESSYGRIRTKRVRIKLPDELFEDLYE